MSSNEKTKLIIEEFEAENSYGKRERMVSDDGIVLDEASKLTICIDSNILLETFQQKNVP